MMLSRASTLVLCASARSEHFVAEHTAALLRLNLHTTQAAAPLQRTKMIQAIHTYSSVMRPHLCVGKRRLQARTSLHSNKLSADYCNGARTRDLPSCDPTGIRRKTLIRLNLDGKRTSMCDSVPAHVSELCRHLPRHAHESRNPDHTHNILLGATRRDHLCYGRPAAASATV
jgi:hypothetical protein